MARGSKSSDTTVSLFPFLAVLVCVMGSLIFLLLATTKRMHEVALAEAEAKLEAEQPGRPIVPLPAAPDLPAADLPVPDLGSGTEPEMAIASPPAPAEPPELAAERQRLSQEWQAKLAELERRRDKLREALRKEHLLQQAARGQVEALQDSVGQSETRLRGVLSQIETLKENLTVQEDLAALEQQIVELRRKLRQLQNRPDSGQSKFAVVPFDVRSGTTRRPILIECTDHGLRFLPEDIIITPSDLEGFTEQDNPLLAGSSALMSYWTAWNMRQPQPDEKPEPYVLLMVRPNGTVAYYVAMRMLSSLKQPHGYELIDESIALQPPPLDFGAQKACRAAIEQQLAERKGTTQHARNGFRSSPGTVSSNGQIRGGASRVPSSDKFEVSDVLPPGDDVGERSWENIDRFEGRRPTKNGTESGAHVSQRPAAGDTPRPKGTAARSQPVAGNSAPAEVAPAGQEPRELPETLTANRVSRSANPPQESAPPDEDEELASGPNPQGSSPGTRPRSGNASREPRDALPSGSRSLAERPGGLARQRGGRRQGDDGQKGPQPHLSQLGRRHWGRSEPNATIGLEQDISIRVDAQQMVVADNHVVRYQPGEQSIDLFMRLMEAVDAESNTWGKPRPGFYWTPRLRFVISPGGNQTFERIDPLSIRSGLSTTREFTLEGVSAAKSEGRP